jgi:hypothetical protein
VASRRFDDEGGVWIRTGIVLGVIFYAGLVVMLAAGFGAILPFVVIPLVLVFLIAANALLGGPRRRERPPPRPIRPTDRGLTPPPPDPEGNGRSGKSNMVGTEAPGPGPRPGDGEIGVGG